MKLTDDVQRVVDVVHILGVGNNSVQPSTTRRRGLNTPEEIALRARVGEHIRGLRLERGLRLADVAALTGLSEPHLSRLEHGQRWPSVQVLLNLSSIFQVDPSTLLTTSAAPAFAVTHHASARWLGPEATGAGEMSSSSAFVRYDRASRLALDRSPGLDEAPTDAVPTGSPEELLGMAFAGSFSMALSRQLELAGFRARMIDTQADVETAASASGHAISKIYLRCDVDIDDIAEHVFREIAQLTTRLCVVGRALIGVEVALEVRLAQATSSSPDPS